MAKKGKGKGKAKATAKKVVQKVLDSTDLDEKLVAEHKESFIPIIRQIINSSISLSHVPNSYKSAVLTPILKNSKLEKVIQNYRPISNLKYASKLIEKVISKQLYEHLQQNDILEPLQ